MRHTLYVYALPCAVAVDEKAFIDSVSSFVASRNWLCPDIWVVNQTDEDGDQDLGLNIVLPDAFKESLGWFSDIEAIVVLCVQLRHDFLCDFVVGIADSSTGVAEDIIEIDDDSPSLDYLRTFIGIEPPSA